MFFWRIDNLVRRLIARDLNEKEAFRYFFAISVLWAITVELPGDPWNVWDAVGAVAGVIVTIVGLLRAFATNGGATGHAFLPRFMAIHWVVAIRFITGGMAVFLPMYALIDVFGTISETTTWWEALVFALFEILLYWRVIVHLKKVASAQPATSNISASSPAAVTSGPAPGPETVSGTES